MAQYIWDIGSENIRKLFETTTMFHDTKSQVLEDVDIDPSTYRDYLNEERDSLSLQNAYVMLETVNKKPKYSFENPDEHIEIPEEEAWGSGRIKLEEEFQSFLFSRELFGPFEADELEEICGIDRQTYRNYREDGRSIPVDVYESLFDFYSDVYSREFDFKGDIRYHNSDNSTFAENVGAQEIAEFVKTNFDSDERFDLALNGSRKRLEDMNGFEEVRGLLIEEMNSGISMTRPRNPAMEEIFRELEEEKVVKKIGKPGRLYRINV